MSQTRRREYLFLQGLAGPFFAHLGRRLAADGHGVHRVNFHGGDWLFWRLPGGVNYRGRAADWPDWIEALMATRGITDVVLFGDCRPMHREAVAVARRLHVAVHVFEEGYIRPDWVTMEVGGVNGHSALPRNLDYYIEGAAGLPALTPDMEAVPTSFFRRAIEDLQYNFAAMLLGPIFRHYRTHRPWHPLIEYAGWARRLLGGKRARQRSDVAMTALRATGRPYFVFPLQLDCDYQVRLHSPFRGLQPAIDQILRSFAVHAPPETMLVCKAHPLDNGLTDWGGRLESLASRLGIADRVVFVEAGDIDLMTRPARGMVTINSTSGTLALAHGIPVIVLGQAVYNVPGITDAGTLDDFWANPVPPRRGAFEAFRRVLVDRCLIRGGYFSDAGLRMLVDSAAARLGRADMPARVPAHATRSAVIDPMPIRDAVRG